MDNIATPGREYSRPLRWYFGPEWTTVLVVIQFRGAASISMGRTSHEVRDEMCRADGC
jgi:hypothetical protein